MVSRQAYSEKADIFSFGMVIYYLYTGKRPFSMENEVCVYDYLRVDVMMESCDLIV